ncbi:MAG: hypothetical protein IPI29_08435 [Ignavibacteria bacterium]|nr:hypothetical protein [Ignavibacteria bacterium]
MFCFVDHAVQFCECIADRLEDEVTASPSTNTEGTTITQWVLLVVRTFSNTSPAIAIREARPSGEDCSITSRNSTWGS